MRQAFFALIAALVLASCDNSAYEKHYKYEIGYTQGRHSYRDYADQITDLPNGCIEYYEVFEKKTKRQCGSYSIAQQ